MKIMILKNISYLIIVTIFAWYIPLSAVINSLGSSQKLDTYEVFLKKAHVKKESESTRMLQQHETFTLLVEAEITEPCRFRMPKNGWLFFCKKSSPTTHEWFSFTTQEDIETLILGCSPEITFSWFKMRDHTLYQK